MIYLRGSLPKKAFSNLKRTFPKLIKEYSTIIQKTIPNFVNS